MCVADASVGLATLLSVVNSDSESGTQMTQLAGQARASVSLSVLLTCQGEWSPDGGISHVEVL